MKPSTYTKVIVRRTPSLGIYKLVCLQNLRSALQFRALRSVENTGNLWETNRWAIIRRAYYLSSIGYKNTNPLAVFASMSGRRFVYQNAKAVGAKILTGPGASILNSSFTLSFRSIFGFSRQMFSVGRISATRRRLQTVGYSGLDGNVNTQSGLLRTDAVYAKLKRNRRNIWRNLFLRNVGRGTWGSRTLVKAHRRLLLSTKRFRSMYWWSASFQNFRKVDGSFFIKRTRKSASSILQRKARGVVGGARLVPASFATAFSSANIVAATSRYKILQYAVGRRLMRSYMYRKPRRLFGTIRRRSFSFQEPRRNGRERRFPNNWRKTRKVIPLKSERNKWILRETGYTAGPSRRVRTFMSGKTFDGSLAYTVGIRVGSFATNFRHVLSRREMLKQRRQRMLRFLILNKWMKVRWAAANRRLRLESKNRRQNRFRITFYKHMLLNMGFRARRSRGNLAKLGRANAVKQLTALVGRALEKRVVAPYLSFRKGSKLLRIRKRLRMRTNWFFRRRIVARIRSRWAAIFGLRRTTASGSLAVSGVILKVYNWLRLRPDYSSMLGVSKYLKVRSNRYGRQSLLSHFNRTGLRIRQAKDSVIRKLNARGAFSKFESLAINGFAYDGATFAPFTQISTNIRATLSSIASRKNANFTMRVGALSTLALNINRRRQISALGRKPKTVKGIRRGSQLFNRRLGFMDKFMAFAILRGGVQNLEDKSKTKPKSIVRVGLKPAKVLVSGRAKHLLRRAKRSLIWGSTSKVSARFISRRVSKAVKRFSSKYVLRGFSRVYDKRRRTRVLVLPKRLSPRFDDNLAGCATFKYLSAKAPLISTIEVRRVKSKGRGKYKVSTARLKVNRHRLYVRNAVKKANQRQPMSEFYLNTVERIMDKNKGKSVSEQESPLGFFTRTTYKLSKRIRRNRRAEQVKRLLNPIMRKSFEYSTRTRRDGGQSSRGLPSILALTKSNIRRILLVSSLIDYDRALIIAKKKLRKVIHNHKRSRKANNLQKVCRTLLIKDPSTISRTINRRVIGSVTSSKSTTVPTVGVDTLNNFSLQDSVAKKLLVSGAFAHTSLTTRVVGSLANAPITAKNAQLPLWVLGSFLARDTRKGTWSCLRDISLIKQASFAFLRGFRPNLVYLNRNTSRLKLSAKFGLRCAGWRTVGSRSQQPLLYNRIGALSLGFFIAPITVANGITSNQRMRFISRSVGFNSERRWRKLSQSRRLLAKVWNTTASSIGTHRNRALMLGTKRSDQSLAIELLTGSTSKFLSKAVLALAATSGIRSASRYALHSAYFSAVSGYSFIDCGRRLASYQGWLVLQIAQYRLMLHKKYLSQMQHAVGYNIRLYSIRLRREGGRRLGLNLKRAQEATLRKAARALRRLPNTDLVFNSLDILAIRWRSFFETSGGLGLSTSRLVFKKAKSVQNRVKSLIFSNNPPKKTKAILCLGPDFQTVGDIKQSAKVLGHSFYTKFRANTRITLRGRRGVFHYLQSSLSRHTIRRFARLVAHKLPVCGRFGQKMRKLDGKQAIKQRAYQVIAMARSFARVVDLGSFKKKKRTNISISANIYGKLYPTNWGVLEYRSTPVSLRYFIDIPTSPVCRHFRKFSRKPLIRRLHTIQANPQRIISYMLAYRSRKRDFEVLRRTPASSISRKVGADGSPIDYLEAAMRHHRIRQFKFGKKLHYWRKRVKHITRRLDKRYIISAAYPTSRIPAKSNVRTSLQTARALKCITYRPLRKLYGRVLVGLGLAKKSVNAFRAKRRRYRATAWREGRPSWVVRTDKRKKRYSAAATKAYRKKVWPQRRRNTLARYGVTNKTIKRRIVSMSGFKPKRILLQKFSRTVSKHNTHRISGAWASSRRWVYIRGSTVHPTLRKVKNPLRAGWLKKVAAAKALKAKQERETRRQFWDLRNRTNNKPAKRRKSALIDGRWVNINKLSPAKAAKVVGQRGFGKSLVKKTNTKLTGFNRYNFIGKPERGPFLSEDEQRNRALAFIETIKPQANNAAHFVNVTEKSTAKRNTKKNKN